MVKPNSMFDNNYNKRGELFKKISELTVSYLVESDTKNEKGEEDGKKFNATLADVFYVLADVMALHLAAVGKVSQAKGNDKKMAIKEGLDLLGYTVSALLSKYDKQEEDKDGFGKE